MSSRCCIHVLNNARTHAAAVPETVEVIDAVGVADPDDAATLVPVPLAVAVADCAAARRLPVPVAVGVDELAPRVPVPVAVAVGELGRVPVPLAVDVPEGVTTMLPVPVDVDVADGVPTLVPVPVGVPGLVGVALAVPVDVIDCVKLEEGVVMFCEARQCGRGRRGVVCQRAFSVQWRYTVAAMRAKPASSARHNISGRSAGVATRRVLKMS